MNLRRYHTISEIFLTNDYRMEWRHMSRWYINLKCLKKTFSFRKHFVTVLTEEIRIAKFCTEVFVMPKHSMRKLNIPESPLYMSPLCAIVLSQQYCRITVIWQNIDRYAPLLTMRRFKVCGSYLPNFSFKLLSIHHTMTPSNARDFVEFQSFIICRTWIVDTKEKSQLWHLKEANNFKWRTEND